MANGHFIEYGKWPLYYGRMATYSYGRWPQGVTQSLLNMANGHWE